MFPQKTLILAQQVIEELAEQNLMIITAESCTGGLIAGALTAVPGSSSVVFGGFVTYANEAKTGMIGVQVTMLESVGAVSKEVACAMAQGALKASKTQVCIAVTGVAGPGGGSLKKPVGLVHIACAYGTKTSHKEMHFGDIGRTQIRIATIDSALDLVLETVINQA